MSHFIESVDLVSNLPQTCFCKDRPVKVNGGWVKYDGRRVYFELDPRTQVKIEAVLGEKISSTYDALPIRRSWTQGIVPTLGGGFDPKTGVYFEPMRIPPRIRVAWSESLRRSSAPGRFDFRDFLVEMDRQNLRWTDPTPEQREENQARDGEAFARLHRKHEWFLGCGFTRVRPDGEFDERGRFVLEVLVRKGMLDQAKRDLPVIHRAGGSDVHKFRGFPIVFRESGPIVAQDRGLGAVLVCDEVKGLSRDDVEKLSAGSSVTASQLSPEDPGIDRQKLIELARTAQEREARNAKISFAVAAVSVSVAAIGLYVNYARTRTAV